MRFLRAALIVCFVAGCGRVGVEPRAGVDELGDGGASSGNGSSSMSEGDARSRASNGVLLPKRDPRDSCDGIGLELAASDGTDSCSPLSCDCAAGGVVQVAGSTHCVTSIDCSALCALGDEGLLRLFQCANPSSCARDSDCPAPQTCVRPASETSGVCSQRTTGAECFSNQDCNSRACVVDADNGRAACAAAGTGAECNRGDQCVSGKCILAANQYLGACVGSGVASPCSSSNDCSAGLTCAEGAFPSPPSHAADPRLGACTNGFPGSPCLDATECLPGYLCLTSYQQCSAGNIGAMCETDTDCPGNICAKGNGTPRCASGADGTPCLLGSECKGQRCIDSECSSGAPDSKCHQDTDCVASSCVYGANLCSDGALGHACDGGHVCQPGLACDVITMQCETK